jgi:hypothetical protein
MGRILPLPLTRRPSLCYNRSPNNHPTLFFSSLAYVWDPQSVCLSFLPSHLFPFLLNTASHRAASRRAAPAGAHDGTDGLPTGTHAEPGSAPRGLPRGERTLYPSSSMPKATEPTTAAPPRRSFRHANQPERAPCACPCPLDGSLQPLGPSPSRKPSRVGVFPLPCMSSQEEELVFWCRILEWGVDP